MDRLSLNPVRVCSVFGSIILIIGTVGLALSEISEESSIYESDEVEPGSQISYLVDVDDNVKRIRIDVDILEPGQRDVILARSPYPQPDGMGDMVVLESGIHPGGDFVWTVDADDLNGDYLFIVVDNSDWGSIQSAKGTVSQTTSASVTSYIDALSVGRTYWFIGFMCLMILLMLLLGWRK